MAFQSPHTVTFSEVDGANILYFSRVFEICHRAFEELMNEVGFPLQKILASREWVMPLVHVECDFKAPMRLGDQVLTTVKVERIGGRSLTFGFEIVGVDGVPRAKVQHVHVVIDPKGKPAPMPEALVAAFEAGGHVSVAP